MLDPVILACVLAGFAGIIAIIFYLFSGSDDEREFEKVFGENARKLFNQEREKHKSKVKLGKKKELKERKNEQKQDTDVETETTISYGQVVDVVDTTPKSTTALLKNPIAEPSDKKQVTKDKISIVECDVEEAKPESLLLLRDELAMPTENPDENKENQNEHSYKENQNEHTSYCDGKKKKRNKGKKEDDDTVNETLPSEKEPVVEPCSSPNNKLEKEKKSKKKGAVVNINDLDSNKVLTRIASLEEIEPEYISYLATYFHDTNAKVHRLEETVGCFEKKEVELKKKIEQHQQSRAIAERQIADHVRVISELTSKVQSLSVAEAASKQQIVHLNNIRIENDSLKTALSKSAVEAAAATKALANFEAVKASNAELSDRLSKVTRSLNESLEQNAALKREITEYSKQTAALENLKLEFSTLDSLARKLKIELEEKTRAFEETKKMATDSDSWKRVESERDEVVHQFAQARIEWEKKEAALMNEYTSLKNLVDELNKEVAKFEQFKKEQDELEQKLLAREAELAEKSARLAASEAEKQLLVVRGNDRSVELETENVVLRKKLSELENELSEAKSSRNLMVTDAADGVNIKDEERIRPMDMCKPSNTLGNNDDVVSLRAANNRLQQKNEELRHRNFKILDHVAELEKQLAETLSSELPSRSKPKKMECNSNEFQLLQERKLVASTIGSIVNSPLDDSNYTDYINDLANSLKAALCDARNCDSDEDKISLRRLQAELERYRGAFNTLSALLTQIELGVHERESFYKDKVAQLQSELDKANGVIASANRLRKELKECEFLKKQIQNLRMCLGQNHEGKGKPLERSCIAKSDESEWEIVNR